MVENEDILDRGKEIDLLTHLNSLRLLYSLQWSLNKIDLCLSWIPWLREWSCQYRCTENQLIFALHFASSTACKKKCLLDRARKLITDQTDLKVEVKHLREVFGLNGYLYLDYL